jgi:hypothetical protein
MLRILLFSNGSCLKTEVFEQLYLKETNREGAEGEKGMEYSGFFVFSFLLRLFRRCGSFFSVLCNYSYRYV